jgi:hypothetical protein
MRLTIVPLGVVFFGSVGVVPKVVHPVNRKSQTTGISNTAAKIK